MLCAVASMEHAAHRESIIDIKAAVENVKLKADLRMDQAKEMSERIQAAKKKVELQRDGASRIADECIKQLTNAYDVLIRKLGDSKNAARRKLENRKQSLISVASNLLTSVSDTQRRLDFLNDAAASIQHQPQRALIHQSTIDKMRRSSMMQNNRSNRR